MKYEMSIEELRNMNNLTSHHIIMPFNKRTTEKYELNGPGDGPKENYGTMTSSWESMKDTENFAAQDALNEQESEDDREEDNGITMNNNAIPEDKDTYFRDGKRKIDFILVYEESNSSTSDSSSPKLTKRLTRQESKNDKSQKLEYWRQKFMSNLRKAGLDMEEEVIEGSSITTHFIKLSAPWSVLVHYAEELNMRAPLQAHPNPTSNWSQKFLKTLHIPNIMVQHVPNHPLNFYTCAFKKSKIDRFLGSDNHDSYFISTQRHQVVCEILQTATYGKKKRAEFGIDRLISRGVYTAAYPLHEGAYEKPEAPFRPEQLNMRQILFEYWARWGRWYKYQPLDHIREYFGEKTAIYFAWLGFYTGWLLPAAIVGLLVFMYGVVTMDLYVPAKEICESGDAFKMCPQCDEKIGCTLYWSLSDICVLSTVSYLFDHPGTVFYAIFVSFWAVSFLEYWKRKSASLAHHWDCLDYADEEERPRPEFAAKAPLIERNPVTGIREPAFPKALRGKRMVAGLGVLLVMISLVIIFIVAVIVYRVLISIPLFQNQTLRSQATTIASMTGAVVNLIFIIALSRVYTRLAHLLTEWEMHRTQTEFEDNLIFKVFLFQFVNFYSSIIYIAFFKGRFVGYPGHYNYVLGLRQEDCGNSGCLVELAQQLIVIMIGKQIINNAQEILIPKIKAWRHRKKVTTLLKNKEKTRWEEDYQLIENEGLFDEYLEMILQFGFITIFVAAFPLAPLFALLNNWVEIRLDAHKFVCEMRRAVAERARNIGVWFTILEALAQLAVISNAFLIAFTSDFLPQLLYTAHFGSLQGYINYTLSYAPNGTMTEECRYRDFRDEHGQHTLFYWELLAIRLVFVIVFEHVVFGICRLIDILVPDIPSSLELKIKRERYLAKQALADSDTIMKAASRKDDDESGDPEESEIPIGVKGSGN
uniref:Anoctamin n=1 Tax=Strigamia maritima TaxID=126957 RepID=T1ISC6_STRMM